MNLLILLIGDNNISNYALIKFLKREEFKFDKVLCVVTNKTESNLNNLQLLAKDEEFIKLKVEDIKGNFVKVKDKIKNKLDELENIENIFLDFTGGLKSMSLGAYLAIDEYELEEDKKYFSYIMYDEGKSKVVFKRGIERELNESLTIDEIAQVHGISELESKTQNSEFYSDDFVLWLLGKIKNSEKEFFENLWDLDNIKSVDWKKSLVNAPVKFNIDEISNKKLKKLQQFIKGDFLEEYIFVLLKEFKEELNIFDITWNVKKGKDANFEVDVVASKNNNLYLFSCTTDKSKTRAKQKGFEAKERATQMGGKNAKAVLVSCIDLSQKNQLEEDLTENKGGESPEVIVYEDLLDKEQLKNKLKDIFR